MLSRRNFSSAVLACAATGCDFADTHRQLISFATSEGYLRIDATTEEHGLDKLLDAFRQLYPGILLEYRRPPSSILFSTFLEDIAAGRPVADIVISSSMDLQFKLVNDGFAKTCRLSDTQSLPVGAIWKDQAYAITAEPIVFAYNRALMPPDDIPRSHGELAELLRRQPERYRGRIGTHDPERSGSGYLYYTQDLMLSRDTMDLAEAIGRVQPKLSVSGSQTHDLLVKGEIWLAYNAVSSFYLQAQSHDKTISLVYPSDYTLVMSRIAFVPASARHPHTGHLFLDFLLTKSAQELLARSYMHPIRADVNVSWPSPNPDVLRPIHFGPALLANLDEFRRRSVLTEWRRTLRT